MVLDLPCKSGHVSPSATYVSITPTISTSILFFLEHLKYPSPMAAKDFEQ